MKIFLLLLMLASPLKYETVLTVSFPNHNQMGIPNYENQNFSQNIKYIKDQYFVILKNINYKEIILNFRMKRDSSFISTQSKKVQDCIETLLDNTQYIHDYINKISLFLKNEIQYSELDLPQQPSFVLLNRKANCVGYAKLCQVLFHAIGVRCNIVQGFFLNKTLQTDILIPISHLWVEIFIGEDISIFYDPQYQSFSHNYILVNENTDFTMVKKFKVKILTLTNKLKN